MLGGIGLQVRRNLCGGSAPGCSWRPPLSRVGRAGRAHPRPKRGSRATYLQRHAAAARRGRVRAAPCRGLGANQSLVLGRADVIQSRPMRKVRVVGPSRPTRTTEVTMYRLRLESCLLLGAALLAGCSEPNTPTAASVRPLAATASAVDGQLYEWSVKCSGDLSSYASWSWKTPLGTTGAISKTCSPSTSPITRQAVRPAAADSFSACVNGTCQKWAVDPARTFTAQLKGSFRTWGCWPSMGSRRGHCGWVTGSATLNVGDLAGST